MRTHTCIKTLLVLSVMICSAGSAWCARKDNGASNYGTMADACPVDAGSASPSLGGVIVLCYSPQSNLDGVATILELYSTKGPKTLIPSLTVDIKFPDGDPTDTMTFNGNFGLITCDNNGSTVPCSNPTPSSTFNMITSGDDLVIKPGSPDSTTLGLGNVEDLVLYFTAPAFVTNITVNSIPNPTPEPSSLALLGFGMLAASFSFFRRGAAKGERS